MYLDLTFCFFFIRIPLLERNHRQEPSRRRNLKEHLTSSARHMFPFLLNLNLNPLYSSLGGSTTRADPLTNKPKVEWLRLNPLYKWKTFNHRTFVLSDIEIHVSFEIILLYLIIFSF